MSAAGCIHSCSSITFKDPELRRASPVMQVLGYLGHMFATSSGSQDTFELSNAVARIDWFISHNWDTPRYTKFATLALFFNTRFSVLLAFAAMAVTFALTAFGKLPLFEHTGYIGNSVHGVYCTVILVAVFLSLLMFGHNIGSICVPSHRQSQVFFDKTCIHQTNLKLKQEGISSLAAFLHCSKGIVIVYTDLYLQKLWTVYELASVLLVNPEVRIELMQTFVTKLVLAALPVVFLEVLFKSFFKGAAAPSAVWANQIVYVIFVLFFVILWRWWAKAWANTECILQRFSISDAKCFCEDDRALVQENVISFLLATGIIGPEASSEEALLTFDSIVQQELPSLFSTVVGPVGIPYRFILIILLAELGYAFDVLSASIHSGRDMRDIGILALTLVLKYLSFLPIYRIKRPVC